VLRGLATAEKHAGEVDVDHRLPVGHAHLPGELPVLELDQQGVAGDARIVDERVDAAAVARDALEQGHDVGFFGHVRAVGLRFGAEFAAGVRGLREAVFGEIHQRELRPVCRQALRHGGAEAAGCAGDDDGLALQFHERSSC